MYLVGIFVRRRKTQTNVCSSENILIDAIQYFFELGEKIGIAFLNLVGALFLLLKFKLDALRKKN